MNRTEEALAAEIEKRCPCGTLNEVYEWETDKPCRNTKCEHGTIFNKQTRIEVGVGVNNAFLSKKWAIALIVSAIVMTIAFS